MKKKRATIVKIIIVLVLILAAVSVYFYYSSNDQNDPFHPDFEFVIGNHSCILTKYNGNKTDVVIPARARLKPVEEISFWAFSNNKSIKSITIPKSVLAIALDMVFVGCENLEKFVVNDKNPNFSSQDGVLYNKVKTLIAKVPQAKTEVTIPASVTTIYDEAFIDCANLTSITLPNSVTTINERAFKDCTSLTSITIPAGVTTIHAGAFAGCTSLTSVTFENIDGWVTFSSAIDVSDPVKNVEFFLNQESTIEVIR